MYSSWMNKIQAPALPQRVLHRVSLVDPLHTAITAPTSRCKLALVCAPGGYGKTTLLGDVAHHTTVPCCWYFLDSTDNDICSFIQTLLASIRARFPHFGQELDIPLQSLSTLTAHNLKNSILQAFTDNFIAALETDIHERFALFLCNYHKINEHQLIQAFLNRLLDFLPDHALVVIESRGIPALKLAPLMAQERLLGIGSNRLRFTPEEIQQLTHLQNIAPFSREEAEYLATTFEGWIVGILLSTRLGNGHQLSSIRTQAHGQATSSLQIDRQVLFSYVADEIFKDEPETYTFLKEISLLEFVSPEMCNQLLEISDAQSRLADVERRGFFVTHSEEDAQILYTCHPVLRELLYREACREQPERMLALHQRAGDMFFQSGEYNQAIAHTLASHDDERTAAIIQVAATQMLQHSYVETLANWIDALHPDTLERSPHLLLLRANIHMRRDDYTQARRLLEKAEQAFHATHAVQEQSPGRHPTPTLLVEILIAKSAVLFHLGDYAQVQRLCQHALQQLPEQESRLCTLTYNRLGICSCLLGDLPTGIAQLHRALLLWGHHDADDLLADIHNNLADAYCLQGNMPLAEHHGARARTISGQTGNVRNQINTLIRQARLQRDRGHLLEAEQLLQDSIEKARLEHFSSGEACALFHLGETYIDQDRFTDALTVTGDALTLARKLEDTYLVHQTLCSLALEYLFLGDMATAAQFLDQVMLKTSATGSYAFLLREQTRGTVLLQQERYQEAYTCFKALELSAQAGQFTRLTLQTALRLAVCQQALGYAAEATLTLKGATTLARRCHQEQVALIELRRFPALGQVLQTLPEQFCLPHQSSNMPVETTQATVLPDSLIVHAGPPALEIHAFGEPALIVEGTPITRWRMARSLELFFFLLDGNRSIRQEQLLTALWEEVDENTPQTLRSAIHYLRKTIGSSCIVYESKMYSLQLEACYGNSIWYDVGQFRQGYEAAKKALKEENTALAKEHLLRAVDLYRGEYVQSFYSNWCIARREELHQDYLDARQELAHMAWKSEQFAECAEQWQHILTLDNYLEEAHHHLMRCYLRMGKRGLALRQYQRYSEILQEELAVSPGPSIQRLYQKLTAGAV